MQLLKPNDYEQIFGDLTEKQTDSLVDKAGGDIAKAGFLGLMAATGYITIKTFFITAIGAPLATMAGTYIFYENKDYLVQKYNETKNFLAENWQ